MRPSGATFWRLGGLSGWQKRTASGDLAVSDRQGLSLAADPDGPLSLTSQDGSFGGLTLPRGMAFDSTLTLYLVASGQRTIRRYDGESRAFIPFASFPSVRNIAIARDWLYVATENDLPIIDLRRAVVIDVLDVEAIDLATHKDAVYIVDAGHVYRHAPYEPLDRVTDAPDDVTRITVDKEGQIYLLRGNVLERPGGTPVTDAGEIRDRFDPPVLRLDSCGRFTLPASLALVCGRSLPKKQAQPPRKRETAPAAAGDFLLYVVEREQRRVHAYTDEGRRLRHSWGACRDWQPSDVAACGDTAFVLDEEQQAVYRHSAGREELRQLFRDETGNRHWTRIVCDRGLLLLSTPGAEKVQVYDCQGRPVGERCYRDVRALFEAERAKAPAPLEDGLVFDRDGNPAIVDSSHPDEKPLYERTGTWRSRPLDSLKYRCQWHRIELGLASFPPGSRISVETCAHENEEDVLDPTRSQFIPAYSFVAPIGTELKTTEFLVLSGLGRYLTLRVRLEGDGFHTPVIASAKVHYPRESYLEYLPATYSADDEMRIFLERFLAIFQTEWDELDREIDDIERLFDPAAVPEGPFLEHLAAQWLALPLEATWDAKQKRRLLSAVPKIYPHRGQVKGLRDFLAVYLANLSGLETKDVQQLEFPVIVEGFREREFLFGGAGDASRLGDGAPLWSAGVTRRLQLGVYSTEGEAALVSVGDPERDVFTEYAHKFRVYVPAAWVRSEADERMIRRALDAEKPAHTQYELCLIEPRFRLGAQSTIGLDTVIGAAPSLRLGCASCSSDAPSLPPAGRLGYDSVLSGSGRGEGELVLA